MFRAISKFTQFWNCVAQIRNYAIANQFPNRNPISKFWYRRRRKDAQEAQASIISGSVLKHLAKSDIPVEVSKMIPKDKKQKIM